MKRLSGKMRFWIFISMLWGILFCLAALAVEDITLFIVCGFFPLLFGWGIAWVIQGYRKNRETGTK